jgi:hypothetical protein
MGALLDPAARGSNRSCPARPSIVRCAQLDHLFLFQVGGFIAAVQGEVRSPADLLLAPLLVVMFAQWGSRCPARGVVPLA